jgi:hypothetical protein
MRENVNHCTARSRGLFSRFSSACLSYCPHGERSDRRAECGRRMTDSEIVRDFISIAELYVQWFDEVISDETLTINMRKLHEILASLQAAAARLTVVAPGDDAEGNFQFTRDSVAKLGKKLPVDAYAMVFNPLEYDPLEIDPPKPVMATISNDLDDIYRDLMEGLALFENGETRSAIWHWHFTYYAHWGRHLSHAQSAIWQYLSEGNWSQ